MKKIIILSAVLSVLLASFSSCELFNSLTASSSLDKKVTGIFFDTMLLEVNMGSDEFLPYSIKPEELQGKVKPKFEFDKEIMSINTDSYGVIITAIKPQSTYIKATINGYAASCIVNINNNGNYIGDPYIYSNSSGIVEIQPQGSQNVSVSLLGGSVTDFNGFNWSSSDNMVANITSAMNNCVVRSYKTGTAQITVSHPSSKYPYTFIVHSFTDSFNSPYLTTASNIITINKNEFSTRNVTVSCVNSLYESIMSRYHWEIDSNGEPPCISVQGNGKDAVITALATGINRIKITNDDCEYPLYILVRVTSAVSNVYVTTSVSTLEIIGSAPQTIVASLEGYDEFYDKSKFVWNLPDDVDNYADYYVYENNLTITGKYNGHFKATVSHELSDYARSVLVILREQEGSRIDNSIYITTDKNYIQTKIGADTIPVSVTLIGGSPGDENNFSWTVDGGENNLFVQFETTHGKINSRSVFGNLTQGTLYISPRSVGSVTVSVSHPKSAYSTDISVRVFSEFAQFDEPLYINSSISSLKKLGGTSEPLSVTLSGNVSPGDENSISWTSSDPSLVSFTPSSGTDVIVNIAHGYGPKQTYITVNHPKAQSAKRILLLSADTQQDLDSLKALYADQTYYRLNVNSTITVSLNAFGLAPSDVIDWSASPNGIVLVEKNASNQLSASISGVADGSVTITANIRNSNSQACVLTLHVLPEGESTDTITASYLTTPKNAVLLENIQDTFNITINGVNIPSTELFRCVWSDFDTSIIFVSPNGASATIGARDFGQTTIKVSHPMSAIDLYIDVKVGALYSWTDELYPYITVESDVVLMIKGQEKVIGASLVNHQATNGFSFKLSGNASIASITSMTNGTCFINALEAGMCEIIVSNVFCDYTRELLLVINNSPEELAAFNYLTTTQNVITIPTNSPATVSVSIPNIANPPSGSFTWQSSSPATVSIVSSGHYAVITGGQSTGTAIITVKQNNCEYPLEIIVNVVDPKLAANNPYIMSPNLITLRVGDPLSSVIAELVGGLPADNVLFNWTCQDPMILDLFGSNESAQIRAKKEGITQIRISHPKSVTPRSILVICEPKYLFDYAITVSENIVRMSPSDNARTITATLVDGTANDVYGFKWWADAYDIIDFNYTGNNCIITPKSTGSTYVHVSHPKSSYTRDILVQISQFSEFKFAVQTLSIAAGTQSFVNLQVPAYNFTARVDYETVDPATGAQISNIISASGTNAVCTVNAHNAGSAILQAKLVNAANGIVQATAQLLVNVTPSTIPSTYINYSGPTIITIEKGVTRQLTATLAGENALIGDEYALQWKISDWFQPNGAVNPNRALNISPNPSLSGTTTNNAVQITGLTDGQECTITISHAKSNTNIILYVIVPGSNAANISLSTGTARQCIVGDSIFTVAATITNPQPDDYDLLRWEVVQDSDVINFSGSGKNVSILPRNPGTAEIKATVNSSGRTASCIITVEPQCFITVDYSHVTTFPGYYALVQYNVSPPELYDCITWTSTDNFYASVQTDMGLIDGQRVNLKEQRMIQIYGGNGTGTTTITGTLHPRDNKNISLGKVTVIVKNGYDNILKLSTSYIRHVPVKPVTPTIAQNPFNVAYEINPYTAELHVTIENKDKLRLKTGSYAKIKDDDDSTYIIRMYNLDSIDQEKGIGYGFIQFEPLGESTQTVLVQAYNKETEIPYSFPPEPMQISMQIYYSQYTFDIPSISKVDGIYSKIDKSIGAIVIGDGETINFSVVPTEEKATPAFDHADSYFQKNSNEKIKDYSWTIENIYLQQDQIEIRREPGGKFIIEHKKDYKGSDTPWGAGANSVDDRNPNQVAFILAGFLKIPYKTFNSTETKYVTVQVYVSIRNCPKTGPVNN